MVKCGREQEMVAALVLLLSVYFYVYPGSLEDAKNQQQDLLTSRLLNEHFFQAQKLEQSL